MNKSIERPIVLMLLAALATPVEAQPVVRTMDRLPDTGQTSGFTATFGEDADYTINAPYLVVNGDGTVTDTVTGLMWQQADGGEMTFASARLYTDTLTLAGHADWRLPDAQEAFSIMDLGTLNPALDLGAFAPTVAEYWWSSDRQANDTSRVWVTNAGGGIGNHPMAETISAGGVKRFHVRAVRALQQPDTLPGRFFHLTATTAADTLTGLVWQRGHCPDTLTWEEALTYADTLTLDGHVDWRLPNIKELRSIGDVHLIGPSLDAGVFGNEGSRKYWSSTTLQNQPAKAWYMNTQFGITTYDAKVLRHDVRCVRGGTAGATGVEALVPSTIGAMLQVYPVPASDMVTVRYIGQGGPVRLEMMDLTGRVMVTVVNAVVAPGVHVADIDVHGLADGAYVLRLQHMGLQQVRNVLKVR